MTPNTIQERDKAEAAADPVPLMDDSPTREETLAAWPDAVWFVGDPAPIGAAVLTRPDVNGRRARARVVALRTPSEPAAVNHCETCTCVESDSTFDGWFIVEDRDRSVVGDPGSYLTFVPIGTAGSRPFRSIEYPPSLVPDLETP